MNYGLHDRLGRVYGRQYRRVMRLDDGVFAADTV
jgi:hypothetical protein